MFRRLLLLVIASLFLCVAASTQTISVFGPLSGTNSWTGYNSYSNGVTLGPVTVSQLPSLVGLANNVIVSDGVPGTSPCTGSGTGALAAYVNGAWNCGLEGGATTVTTTLPITGGPCTSTCTLGVNGASTSNTGVLQLTGDFAGTSTSPTVVNGSHITNASIPNSGLVSSAVTVSPGTGLSGGGSVSLGGSVTLNANSATGSALGMIELTNDLGGTAILPTVVNGSHITNASIANSGLANPSMTVGGATCTLGGSCSPSASGGGNPTLDNCTPDETGNSFYSVTSLTEYFYAAWQFIPGSASYINCTVYIPTAQTGATIVLDIAANDATAGHTANFQTCDEVINTGTINPGSALTCASTQTFTTTSTAYNRVTLTFNVQSTLSNGSILIVKIATATTGTQPTANIMVYPHFVL